MKTKTTIQTITLLAVLIALTYVATSFLKIPIPYGYVNMGLCILFLASYFSGIQAGIIAGSIGSALADLLSPYSIWTIPTFIIKIVLAMIVGLIFIKSIKKNPKKVLNPYTILAIIVGILIHVVGYTIATIILGDLPAITFLTVLPFAIPLFIEGIINGVAFVLIALLLRKHPYFNRISK